MNNQIPQNPQIPQLETLDTIPGYQIESNIPQLAEQIFSVPAGPPFSISLELETNDVEPQSPEQAQTIFEILAHLLLYGIRIKYGEDQDPKRLTQTQITTITEYMRSFGFNVVLSTYALQEQTTQTEYSNCDIEYYRLRMIDSEKQLWHDIKIEPYKNY